MIFWYFLIIVIVCISICRFMIFMPSDAIEFHCTGPTPDARLWPARSLLWCVMLVKEIFKQFLVRSEAWWRLFVPGSRPAHLLTTVKRCILRSKSCWSAVRTLSEAVAGIVSEEACWLLTCLEISFAMDALVCIEPSYPVHPSAKHRASMGILQRYELLVSAQDWTIPSAVTPRRIRT